MLKKYQIQNGKIVQDGAQECPIFVYINPDETERKYLIETLQIDEHTFNSALDPDELGRVEFEANHTAMIIKRPKRYSSEDNFLFKISSVGLFVFADKLIVLLSEEVSLFDGRLFNKIRSLNDLLLKIMHRCILHFEEHLHVIQKISDELEIEINKAMHNRDLVYMFNLEKSLVYYLKAIVSNGKVIEKLKANTAKISFTTEAVEYIDDVIIENSQCLEEANTYSQVLSGMMDAWVSIVSNNLNIRIKALTILTLCIMMPTLIVSIFSMNVPLPIAQEGTVASFWIILGMAVASAAVIAFIWRYRKW